MKKAARRICTKKVGPSDARREAARYLGGSALVPPPIGCRLQRYARSTHTCPTAPHSTNSIIAFPPTSCTGLRVVMVTSSCNSRDKVVTSTRISRTASRVRTWRSDLRIGPGGWRAP
eukprot:657173-Rhodomonas_salina.1